jgi:phosphoglycerate dehydrogenase-like enzyme
VAHDCNSAQAITVLVLILSPLWQSDLPPQLAKGLMAKFVDPSDTDATLAALADAEIVVSAWFTAEMMRASPKLKLLVCPAAGTDSIDRAALPQRVKLINGGGHEIPIAEYIIGALVALRQQFLANDAALRVGKWRAGFLSVSGFVDELYSSNIGFVGFGRIAQETARRAQAFGMRLAAVTAHPDTHREQAGALEFLGGLNVEADVDRLACWSDALVLCCELSPLTRGLLDRRRLAKMKPQAVVINVSRGAVAVEQDLYEALASKAIAGAALDVWYRYPEKNGEKLFPSELAFHKLDNVLMTPHASAWTENARRRRLGGIVKAINEFAKGSL